MTEMWFICAQIAAALYLVGGSLTITAEGLPSKFIFKVLPMLIGLPLAIGVAGKLLGWPI